MKGRVEWPTVLLIVGAYLFWSAILAASPVVGPAASAALLVPVLVLHSSLQHECLHGHPFRRQRLNDLIATPGLGLFLPYGRFAATHRAHHATPHLTDPDADPESHYVSGPAWAGMGPWRRRVRNLNRCLLGRILLGPPMFLAGLVVGDWRAIGTGDLKISGAWIIHLGSVVAVIALVLVVSTIPLWLYFLACWAALSVLAIRTFLEHRAAGPIGERSVIIERGGILGLLFLNNHLHAVHHARSNVAWYRLPSLYRRQRARFVTGNGGYAFPSYASIIRRYFFRAKEPAIHPGARKPVTT